MDEPDVDELAWMASEHMDDDDDEIFNDVFLADPDPSEPPEDSGTRSTADVAWRKRVQSDSSNDPTVQILEKEAKRTRSSLHVTPPSKSSCTPPSPTKKSPANARSEAVKTSRLPEVFRSVDLLPCRLATAIDGDYIPVTAPSGERVYAKVKYSDDSISTTHASKFFPSNGLLLQSIEEMVELADRECVTKTLPDTSQGDLSERISGHPVDDQLWVEKYAPKSFTDLLSDEKTNRQVLRWLKQWDSCVFGHKQNSLTSKEALASLRQKVSNTEGRGSFKIYKQDHKRSTRDGSLNKLSSSWMGKEGTVLPSVGDRKSSESNEKVLLLCGPPGLGKTTLAHIVAKHCGYRAVEINASDDRVASTLQGKILDAVQMKSVIGDGRPNCLIIDEIDGAVGGVDGRSAITSLVDIITSDNGHKGDAESQDGSKKRIVKKKKTTATGSLSRPIICICNDLYSPSLRPLRQVARVHAFVKPSATRVVARLKQICKEEGFKVNVGALTSLAEHSESDIRACLNTLQFLKRKGQRFTSEDVGLHLVGVKDINQSMYDIWGQVFRKIKPRSTYRKVQTGAQSRDAEHIQFVRLYDLIANHGDHELAVDGIHENLLRTGYQDSSLARTVQCLNAICDSDIRNHQVYSKQHFFLNGYQPSTLMTIRGLVAVPVRPNLQWPRSYQRYKSKLAFNSEMLNTWLNTMSPTVSRSVSNSSLTLDMVSPLLAILCPPLRPVTVQLHTKAEKETMKKLVDTMASLGLTYRHDQAVNMYDDELESSRQGHREVSLDPAVHSLVNFEGYKMQHRQLSASLCQMVGHQIELERIRRNSVPGIKSDQVVGQESQHNHTKHSDGILVNTIACGQSDPPNGRQEQKREKADYLPKVGHLGSISLVKNQPSALAPESTLQSGIYHPKSFFDGWKKDTQSNRQKMITASLPSQRDSRPLLYKFHEGFTNAIRRPMLVREFLQL